MPPIPLARQVAVFSTVALFALLATVPVAAAVKCPIRIGNVRAETGGNAAYGQSMVDGLQMGFEKVNAEGGIAGCKVELVTYDSQSLPANAATLTQRLLYQDRVDFIIASSISLEVLAQMQITEPVGMPLYVPSAASAKVTNQGAKWVWRQSAVDLSAAKVLAKYIVAEKKWDSFGVIFENTDFGKVPVNSVLLPTLKEAGATVVASETVNPGDSDLSGPLLRLRDAGAKAIIFWGHDKEGALMLRQMHQLGFKLPVAANTGIVYPNFLTLLSPEVQKAFDFLAIAQFVWTDQSPALKSWIAQYRESYKRLPDATSIDAYDAAFVIKKAIETAGDKSAAALQKAFSTVQYQGTGGDISFDEAGQARRPLVLVKLTPKEGLGYEVVRTLQPNEQ